MSRNESVIRANDSTVTTLISIFDVESASQKELVELLVEGADKVMRHRPGFISVNILASTDGTRVVNYAQWRSPDDIAATMADPDAQSYAKKAGAIARPQPQTYSVASVHHA